MATATAGTYSTRWGTWRVVFTFIVVLMMGIGVILVGMWVMPTSVRLGLWIVVLVLLTAFAAVIGYAINRRWLGILIDGRNKMCLSRFQIVLWLFLIFSAFLAAALSNLHLALFSTPVDALSISIPAELLALLGVSATSLVGSAFVLHVKSGQHKIDTREHPSEAAWSDMFKGDDHSNSASVDFSKVQMFYITIILVLVYGAALAAMFLENNSRAISAFPALNATLVTLLGISHATYLGYKAVPHQGSKASDQTKGSGNQQGSETNHPQ